MKHELSNSHVTVDGKVITFDHQLSHRMKAPTLDSKKIDTLRDLPDMIPVFREYFEDWMVWVLTSSLKRTQASRLTNLEKATLLKPLSHAHLH